MKNLIKNLSFLIAIFSIIILLSSFFAEKTSAQQNGTCSKESTRGGIRWICSLPNLQRTTFTSQDSCNLACTDAVPPTPTPTLPPSFAQLGQLCSPGRTACVTGLTCSNIDQTTGYGECAVPPTPTLAPGVTPANTPTPTPVPTARLIWQQIAVCTVPTATPTSAPSCAGVCGTSVCATCSDGTRICGTTDLNTCPSPTAATPTSPNPFSKCANQYCDTKGGCDFSPLRGKPECQSTVSTVTVNYYICGGSTSEGAQTIASTLIGVCGATNLTPAPTPTPLPLVSFECVNQIAGPHGGNYSCVPVVNTFAQCPDGYSEFLPGTVTSCNAQDQRCCKQNPVTTPSPTPLPGFIQLALAITQQELVTTPVNRNRSVTVVLQGADDQTITRTGTVSYSNGTFNGTINLGLVPSGPYELKVGVGKFLRSPIIKLAISGTAVSAQTTVVAGLAPNQNNDNVDAISYYYADGGLKSCFGSTIGIKKCDAPQDVDLNGDGNVDGFDHSIYLKGIRKLVRGLPV